MAYGVYLASVPEEQIRLFQKHALPQLQPAFQKDVSHLLAYWVEEQPLGKLLGEAIDGGQRLREDLWHPYIKPRFHLPAEVSALAPKLQAALDQTLKSLPVERHENYSSEINMVIAVFDYATLHSHCVVSALDHPFDEERASRVITPFPIPRPS